MNRLKLGRQHLNLVLGGQNGLYSIGRMDISGLFYPSTAEARAKGKKNGIDKLQLMGSIRLSPRPSIYYRSLRSDKCYPQSVDLFALFGKSRILCADAAGYTSAYNTLSHSFLGLPMLKSPKGPKTIAVSIPHAASGAEPHGDHIHDVYIMDMVPSKTCCFEVLSYCNIGGWRWHPLPLPPFFHDPEYEAPVSVPFAVVDGTRICVSTATATYSFDTVACEWSKLEGDWVLPFQGKAEYVPELGLWLGVSAHSPYGVCALDLSAAAAAAAAAVGSLTPVQHLGLDLDPPQNWSLISPTLVNLGSGKFCIVKFFDVDNEDDEYDPQMVVFTGVEVVPSDDDGREAGRLCMISHKSKCLVTDCIDCVL